ncbi:hypothetical protein DGG96_14440 [Legionella qingyii]|uniref:Uncharacterized protein n=1 Tax=Legionella qingyii TaxID=2184757 RepID=A0A317U289_9GAMM|nr:hypothetical protein DGG96_14440 [Legionella qingyii]
MAIPASISNIPKVFVVSANVDVGSIFSLLGFVTSGFFISDVIGSGSKILVYYEKLFCNVVRDLFVVYAHFDYVSEDLLGFRYDLTVYRKLGVVEVTISLRIVP